MPLDATSAHRALMHSLGSGSSALIVSLRIPGEKGYLSQYLSGHVGDLENAVGILGNALQTVVRDDVGPCPAGIFDCVAEAIELDPFGVDVPSAARSDVKIIAR